MPRKPRIEIAGYSVFGVIKRGEDLSYRYHLTPRLARLPSKTIVAIAVGAVIAIYAPALLHTYMGIATGTFTSAVVQGLQEVLL